MKLFHAIILNIYKEDSLARTKDDEILFVEVILNLLLPQTVTDEVKAKKKECPKTTSTQVGL